MFAGSKLPFYFLCTPRFWRDWCETCMPRKAQSPTEVELKEQQHGDKFEDVPAELHGKGKLNLLDRIQRVFGL